MSRLIEFEHINPLNLPLVTENLPGLTRPTWLKWNWGFLTCTSCQDV